MRKSRFSGGRIGATSQEYAAGAKLSELCRKHGMSDATLCKRKCRQGACRFPSCAA